MCFVFKKTTLLLVWKKYVLFQEKDRWQSENRDSFLDEIEGGQNRDSFLDELEGKWIIIGQNSIWFIKSIFSFNLPFLSPIYYTINTSRDVW